MHTHTHTHTHTRAHSVRTDVCHQGPHRLLGHVALSLPNTHAAAHMRPGTARHARACCVRCTARIEATETCARDATLAHLQAQRLRQLLRVKLVGLAGQREQVPAGAHDAPAAQLCGTQGTHRGRTRVRQNELHQLVCCVSLCAVSACVQGRHAASTQASRSSPPKGKMKGTGAAQGLARDRQTAWD